jgi:hypothetical protein
MTIPQMYMYDLKTGEYTGSRDATRRPNGEYILEATGATSVAPPAVIPTGQTARWTGDAWETVEDHRQHMDERGRKEGGTQYWLPGDTWRSEPRYTEELGPLPAEAILTKPEKPAPTIEELTVSVRTERNKRIAATDYLVMPDYPISQEKLEEIKAYRQALRDLPQEPGFPWNSPDDPACPWPVLSL